MKTRILVVEDEGLTANNLADNLRTSGYEVAGIAPSGEEALEKARRLKPDLVLMDIHLSGKMDGIETAARIRTDLRLPVIFLTAHADQSVLDRAKLAQPFGYLLKPFRRLDLVTAVEMASHKHQIDRALEKREAWLDTSLSCAGEGVIVTDRNGHIEFLNDLSKQILSLHDSNVIGRNFFDVVALKSRITDTVPGDLVQLAILQGATMDIGKDLSVVSALHDRIDLEGEIALRKVGGSIAGAIFTFRDVTVRNLEEEQQRQRLVTKSVSRLAGAVSNELKHLQHTPSKIRVEVISRMKHQLDEVSRKEVSFPCTLNLNAVISDACHELRLKIPSNTQLATQLNPELDTIYADPAQLKQAITNLILYSLDSMPDGGIVWINTRNCGFERRGRSGQLEHYVRLTIKNTGFGLQQAEANRLFEPFSHADPVTEKLDLRLFIVHGIIADAKGSIRVEASPSQGTAFEILLPQRGDNGPILSTAAVVGKAGPDQPAILLVQADHAVRSLLSDSLESQGYEVLGARDAEAAIEWMGSESDPVALLITDLVMPDISGPALAGQISLQYPQIRAIFIVDHPIDPSLQDFWIEKGARFIDKPFQREELLELVNEMLEVVDPPNLQVASTTIGR